MCVRCAFDAQVEFERRTLENCIEWCNDNGTCVYCGEPEEHREHVVPRHTGLPTFVVPACAECNLVAGGNVFPGIIEKQEFIRDRIKKRYGKLLRMPEWDDQEISELKGRLRRHVEGCSIAAKWVKSRLAWEMTSVASVDA